MLLEHLLFGCEEQLDRVFVRNEQVSGVEGIRYRRDLSVQLEELRVYEGLLCWILGNCFNGLHLLCKQ